MRSRAATRERSSSNPSAVAPQVAALTPAPGSPAAAIASRAGLRVRPYRPMRALAGALIVVASVVAALAIYVRIGDRTEMLAVNRTVLAGEQITEADLRVVSISSDDAFPAVPAADRAAVVGQYARVRLAAGSLLVSESLQPERLVDPGRVLMSVVVPVGQVPVGLREQSRVALVVTPPRVDSEDPQPVLVEAIVVAVPRNLAELVGADASPQDMLSLSVEVAPQWVTLIGSAAAVSVGVLDPQAPFPSAIEPTTTALSASTVALPTTTVPGAGE